MTKIISKVLCELIIYIFSLGITLIVYPGITLVTALIVAAFIYGISVVLALIFNPLLTILFDKLAKKYERKADNK